MVRYAKGKQSNKNRGIGRLNSVQERDVEELQEADFQVRLSSSYISYKLYLAVL